jgi:hypothetical protein
VQDATETPDAEEGWKVNVSYLQQVVDNPQEYIDNPAKLDFDWLRDRLKLF